MLSYLAAQVRLEGLGKVANGGLKGVSFENLEKGLVKMVDMVNT